MNVSQLTAALLTHVEGGGEAVLCTIVESSGSVPRKNGARMAMLSTGAALGTVGGGRVEYLAQQHAQAILRGEESDGMVHYTLTGKESNTGMACGGEVKICFQYLNGASADLLRQLQDVLRAGRPAALTLDLRQGTPVMTVQNGTDGVCEGLRDGIYGELLCTDGTVYIFGAGHVSKALAPVLGSVDFRVVVLDARPELACRERFPQAAEVIAAPFDRIGAYIHVTQDDYVVVMTPGHQDDQKVLEQTLGCAPAYIGCMGSRRKKAAVWAELEKFGYSKEQIDRIHLPIGLTIGAQTPAEIAISIAGELIAFRAEKQGARSGACPA